MSKKPLIPLCSSPGQTDLLESLVAPDQVDLAENTSKGLHSTETSTPV